MQNVSPVEKVRVGNHVIKLASIAAVHWEKGDKLFVHMDGGRFLQLEPRSSSGLRTSPVPWSCQRVK
jgi:hypothetical protein